MRFLRQLALLSAIGLATASAWGGPSEGHPAAPLAGRRVDVQLWETATAEAGPYYMHEALTTKGIMAGEFAVAIWATVPGGAPMALVQVWQADDSTSQPAGSGAAESAWFAASREARTREMRRNGMREAGGDGAGKLVATDLKVLVIRPRDYGLEAKGQVRAGDWQDNSDEILQGLRAELGLTRLEEGPQAAFLRPGLKMVVSSSGQCKPSGRVREFVRDCIDAAKPSCILG